MRGARVGERKDKLLGVVPTCVSSWQSHIPGHPTSLCVILVFYILDSDFYPGYSYMAFELLGLGPQGTALRTVATNSKVFLPRCMIMHEM